jgi:TRAP-type C4-dicarboxylate transport system substrate-binding protein
MWAKEMEKRSQGRVKVIKWVYGGAICPPTEQLGCIARGIADFGYAAPAYNPAMLRLATMSEMLYVSTVVGSDVRARAELYKTFPPFREEMRAVGLEVLTFHPPGPGLIGISKRKKIRGTADFKGLKAHTYGPMADVMKRVGMVPVSMPIGEVYESMQRGVIDGYWVPFSYLPTSKFYEVSGTLVDPLIGVYSCPFLVMNKDTYDRFPEDIKKIIEDLRLEQIIPEVKAGEEMDDKGIALIRKEAPDLEYVQFSEKARSAWREKARIEEIYDKFIKERESRSPQTREFFRKYLELVKKYEPEMKKIYTDPFEKLGPRIID